MREVREDDLAQVRRAATEMTGQRGCIARRGWLSSGEFEVSSMRGMTERETALVRIKSSPSFPFVVGPHDFPNASELDPLIDAGESLRRLDTNIHGICLEGLQCSNSSIPANEDQE
ncbi:hypothetical protein MRB53_022040 [Persea americana]|uniref:Uncharacterized protein n=1 Tax=Persea americana TaxID=3435 RepID=A0ACC2L5T7_PERAE|nr:hypothetical protein MRB53_022040 [Persea americana]